MSNVTMKIESTGVLDFGAQEKTISVSRIENYGTVLIQGYYQNYISEPF